jgi:uncharacterized protein with HEPN domain
MLEKDKANTLAIEEAIAKILSFTKDFQDANTFYNDIRTFDAVLMNFVIIGESISRLSEYFRSNNSHIEWQKIKDFRNIVAQDYFGIDPEAVWQIVKNHLPKFQINIQDILQND